MSWEYVHLVLNPFPIVLSVVGCAVGLAGWAWGREALERYGVLSLLLAGAAALPSYYTGLAAGDVVGRRTFVSASAVDTHQTWATWAAVLLVSVGVFAGFSLWQSRDRRLRRFVIVTGALAAGLTGYAAWLGGQIVHGGERGRGPVSGTGVGAASAPTAADSHDGAAPRTRALAPAVPPSAAPPRRAAPFTLHPQRSEALPCDDFVTPRRRPAPRPPAS